MSKAPSKAPSRAPGTTSTGTTSTAPLASRVPSRALISAHPSTFPSSQAPGRLVSVAPSRAPQREATRSPSQAPLLPASILPPPSLVPPSPAVPLSSKTYLAGGAPPSVHPSASSTGSLVPGAAAAPPRVTSPHHHHQHYSPSIVPRPVPAATVTATASPTSVIHQQAAAAPPPDAPGLRSVYKDPEDLRRARLQTVYGTLAPAERAGQDAWATRKADEFAPCPFDFPWERDADCPGYRCAGGAHYMSDMILAEGVPGLYARPGCHTGLRNWDREPTEQEQVPPGMYGPIRPLGVDGKGRYTYREGAVDRESTRRWSRTGGRYVSRFRF